MKRLIVLLITIVSLNGVAYSQLQLQCPPCLPVKGCDKCWASVADANNNGCNSAARIDDSKDETLNTLPKESILFPNPVLDILNIRVSDELSEYVILDSSGKVILKGAGTKVNVQHLRSGLYLIHVGSQVHRFLKE